MRSSPTWYPQLMTLMHALIDKSELLLQGTDFVSNLLYRLIACFNLYGVQRRIHMDSCHAYTPSNIAFCVSAILFQLSPVTYSAQASSLSSEILSGYFPSVRMSYKYLLSRIISSRISCQSGIGVRAIRMIARIAPTNAAAPMTANTFLLSFFFAALQISAAQAMQTAAATSAMPSVSHSQDSSYRIFMRSSSPVR